MMNANRFRVALFVAAYIGTLGIPGTPRDVMWATELLPSADKGGPSSPLREPFSRVDFLPSDDSFGLGGMATWPVLDGN
jgi:hypothetical protein